jgi:hypothetical protein
MCLIAHKGAKENNYKSDKTKLQCKIRFIRRKVFIIFP